jgi:3'-phosphoadenosine 5'-phosphosulfate (PAPS) 3'-phosphatase
MEARMEYEVKKRIEIIIPVLLSSSRMVKQMRLKVSHSIKPDGTPVSEADIKIAENFLNEVSKMFPHDGIITEETQPYLPSTFPQYVWLFDPIDGTKVFLQKGKFYSILLTLLKLSDDGYMPVFGIILSPENEVSILGGPSMGIWYVENSHKIPIIPSPSLNPPYFLHIRDHFEEKILINAFSGRREFELVISSTLRGPFRHCGILFNIYDAVIRGGPKGSSLWDIGPLDAIFKGGGLILTDQNGLNISYTPPFTQKVNILVTTSSPHIHELIIEILHSIPAI